MNDDLPPRPSQTPGQGEANLSPLASIRNLLEAHPYLTLETKGLFVNLEKLGRAGDFEALVDQVFMGGHYFTGLSYKNLNAVLYSFASVKAHFPRLRLADGIAPLLPRRESLYAGELLLTPQRAEYDFTLRLDSRATFAQGVAPPSANEAPRTLDEFVAIMWRRGVRFGLDLEAVSQGLAIAKNKLLRLVIAREQPPQPGADAKLEHVTSLEKDLRPLETAEGEVDLRRYSCVFPQAREKQTILRKIPATMGVEGRTVTGEPIPTIEEGKDLDLETLSGEGTTVAQAGKFQALLATRAGFISVNPQTGQVSITDEVINHEPVGIKTGSLDIEAELCIQLGGVGHGYSLEGRNLELRSGRVEGGVLSRQGNVSIAEGVAGGRVTALDGDITVKGPVMAGSHLEAYAGSITVGQAENCVLVGRMVVAQRVVNANIIAEQAVIKESVGSRIFAFSARIERIVSRASSLQTPDLSGTGTTLVAPIVEPPRRPIVIIQRTIETLLKPLPDLEAKIDQIGDNPEVQTYLRAVVTYQSTKDEEQARKAQSVFMAMEDRVRPLVDHWRALKQDREKLMQDKAKLEAELEGWRDRVRRLEQDLQGSMQYVIGAVGDFNSTLKLYQDPRIPENFSQLAAQTPGHRRQFENMCLQILTQLGAGHAKERLIPLKGPVKSSYRELMALLSEARDKPTRSTAPATPDKDMERDNRREKRLTLLDPKSLLAYLADPERRTPSGRYVLPLKVDELLEGFIGDLSGLGLSVLFDRRQRYAPAFEKDDKVSLVFTLGSVSFKAEMVAVTIEESPRLARLGGYFVNMPPSLQASIYKMKNMLESRLWSGDAAPDPAR